MSLRPEIVVRDFSEEKVKEYIEKLNEISASYPSDQPIIIRVDSYGGEIYGLASLYEHIQTLPNPIITYTTSKAMSAGAILLSSGDKGARFASPNSMIMIHEISAGTSGDIKDIKDYNKFLIRENKRWMQILSKNMNKTYEQLREVFKKKCEGHDLYLTPVEAKKIGLIDEICYLHMQPSYHWLIKKDSRDRKKLLNAAMKKMVKGE